MYQDLYRHEVIYFVFVLSLANANCKIVNSLECIDSVEDTFMSASV